MPLTRRDFLATSALASATAVLPTVSRSQSANSRAITVGEILDRIQQQTGLSWTGPTVDNLIFGERDFPVRAIGTTMMSTLEVCRRAQALGANLLVTHEPTFYLHEDKTDDLKDNPVVQAKEAFLAQHGMAIFRLHDHIHAMHPDGIARGMMDQLGWQAYAGPDLHRFSLPGIPLAQLAGQLATKLNAGAIRVIGDPDLRIHTAAANWGYASRERGIALLADPTVDLLLAGEAREWEVVEYAQDAIAAGQRKALILLGHVVSEQGGMIWATDWMKTFVPEVPITFIPAPEPFWLPGHPPRSLRV